MKQYWLTSLSVLIGVLLLVMPIAGGLAGDTDDLDTVSAIVLPAMMVFGALLLAGLWWLRSGRFSDTVCLSLIAVGLVLFGVFFFWLLLIPTLLALIVLWFGIVKRGLVRELRPTPST